MANKFITLNGVALHPTSIQKSLKKVGRHFEMANGSNRFLWRATKSSWTITWENVPEASLSPIVSLFLLNTVLPFTDEKGGSTTVIVKDDPYEEELHASKIGANGTFYYTVSMTLTEV